MYTFKTIKPSGALQSFIECYIIYRGDLKPPLVQNLVPGNMQHIGFVLNGTVQAFSFNSGSTFSKSYVLGQLTRPLSLNYSGKLDILAIHFKPVGMYQLFGIPMYSFTNHIVDFASIAGTDGSHFIKKIFESPAVAEQIETIESFLSERVTRKACDVSKQLEYACAVIMDKHGNISIKDLARRVNMCERNLERHFLEQVGISPKTFASVARLKKTMEMIECSAKCNWKDITYTLEFTDQAHFIHEFKKLAGKTPTDYCSARSDFEHFFYGNKLVGFLQ